jgi:hypothetical protein
MKVIKTASGNRTLKISKSEWENIGVKAKWIRASAAYMSKTASRNIRNRNALVDKYIKQFAAQPSTDILTQMPIDALADSIRQNMSVFGYGDEFYFESNGNQLSQQEAESAIAKALFRALGRGVDRPSLQSIVAHAKAGKPYMVSVVLDKDGSSANNVRLSVSLNGQTMNMQTEFNGELSTEVTPFMRREQRGSQKGKSKGKSGIESTEPRFKRPVGNSDDAAEAAKAAGYIAANVDFKFMVQQSAHEKRETNAPGLGYGGGFWIVHAILSGTGDPAKAQEMLSYFTDITSMNKAVREGRSKTLLTLRDENYELSFNLGVSGPFNEFVNRVAAENEKEVRQQHEFVMDLGKYKNEILGQMLKSLPQKFVEDYQSTREDAEQAVADMFNEGMTE